MNFDNVKSIVDNRMCEPDNTEKQAENLAKRTIEKEENQKAPKKDSLNDMQRLANAKNTVSAMVAKVKQQSKEEEPTKAGRPKGSKNKTTSKRGPGRPPKEEKRGPGRPPKKDSEKKEPSKRGPGRPPKEDKEDK